MPDIIATNLAGKKVTETYKGVLHFDSALGIEAKPVYDGAGTKTSLSLGAFRDKAIISGDLQVQNDLTISSNSTLVGNVSVGGDLQVLDDLTIFSDSTLVGNVSVGGDLQVQNDLTISSDSTLVGNVHVGGDLQVKKDLTVVGDITLTNGGLINDLVVGSVGNNISLRSPKTTEVGKLRIRESETDYELLFGNPTVTPQNLFSIIVKKDGSNNLYIKNNYSDPDISAPLWINRATGEVNIKMLNVGGFRNDINIDGSTTNRGGGLFPTGGIMMFTVAGIPTGWLECDGRDLSINEYNVLYGVIGQNYKTNSGLANTRFQIPDMRGLFVRGWAHGSDIDYAGRPLGSKQEDEFESHTHELVIQSMMSNPPVGEVPIEPIMVENYTERLNSTQQILNAGGGTETRPKNIALIYCIKT
jgi:hypothetical protein